MPFFASNAGGGGSEPAPQTPPRYGYAARFSNHTITAADEGTVQLMNSPDPVTVYVPRGDSGQAGADIPIGARFEIQQMGAGQVTVAGADGFVTILPTTLRKTTAQWSTVYLTRQSTNTWFLSGQLSA